MTDTAILSVSRWQREHAEAEAAEIRDTIAAYEDLARLEVGIIGADDNHADHMAYKRDQMAKEAWRS